MRMIGAPRKDIAAADRRSRPQLDTIVSVRSSVSARVTRSDLTCARMLMLHPCEDMPHASPADPVASSARYADLIESAGLPDLAIVSTADPDETMATAASFDVALGDPALLRRAMPALTSLVWVQSTWAGVEPLLDPALRRDYVLTNARGVFGPQMSEYVFAYLLAHERNIFEKRAAQSEGRWDPTPPTRLRGKQSACSASAPSAPRSREPRSISAWR